MATPPLPSPIVSHTITGTTLTHNVTSNKQVRATIKAHKALLKTPQARTIPWRQFLDAEKDKIHKLREYYIVAEDAYHHGVIDILDVLTFWDLNEEHYYAVKRWRQLRDRYNTNWDSEGNPIMGACPTVADPEDSGSDTEDDDYDSEEENEAGWEENGAVTESEAERQSVPEIEKNQPVVYRPHSRRGRGAAHTIRPLTPIDE